MKKLMYSLSLFSIAFLIGCGGNNKKDAAKESFEDLGDNAEFREKHDEPRETEESEFNGKMIEIAVADGMSANAYALTTEGSSKYLLVFHEWWGLNSYVKQEADRLAESLEGVNVIALDLYDGKVAEVRDSAQKYMQSANEERLNAIVAGAMAMIPSDATIGTIGWCFGGGWSLKGSLAAGYRAEACVMFYGMPVQEREILKGLESDVLFIYGKQDKWINEDVANQFVENMKGLEEDLIVKGFDADHAFANPTQESYNEEAATEANAMALEFLKSELLEEDVENEDDDREEVK